MYKHMFLDWENAPSIALSSWALSVYNGAPQNTASDDYNYNGIAGGDNWMATSYFNRGQGVWSIPGAASNDNINVMSGGPVLVSNNPLNAFPLSDVNNGQNLSNSIPPSDQAPAYTLTAAYYFDQPGSGRSTTQNIAAVQQAITTYGAVATYMYAGGYTVNRHDVQVFQWDAAGGYEYSYDPSANASDHVVTIIGWNNNITLPGQSSPGAWIVQNSWGAWGGTSSSNDGTFYAPYTDPYIGQQGVTAYKAIPAGKYSPIVLQNELGPTWAAGNWGAGNGDNSNDVASGMGIISSTNSSSIALSKLTVSTQSLMIGVGLYSLDSQLGNTKSVTVNFYDGFTVFHGIGSPGDLLESQSFTFAQAGYSVFDLNTPLSLTPGEILSIEVNYNGSDIPYVWQTASNGGTNAPTDLTYFQDTNGNWVDFATYTQGSTYDDQYPGIFSVKGLMAVPEPSAYLLLGLGLVVAICIHRKRNSLEIDSNTAREG